VSGSEAHDDEVGERRRRAEEVEPMDWKLELIALPVADVDRAIAFYRDQLGWSLDHDHTVSDEVRFVQVTPPGSGCSIAIGKGLMRHEQGAIRTLQVVVEDIEAAHAHLAAAGVAVSAIEDLPFGSFVYFDDPDGNSWAVQQTQPRRATS
jgi:predicted enzyme related to lactoylglutathione lyase